MLLHKKISIVIICLLFKIKFHACKVAHKDPIMKIFNGTRATEDPNIKHMVSLRSQLKPAAYGEDHICGGSIIKANLILTAAHCVAKSDDTNIYDPKYFYIVAGSPYLYSKNKKTQVLRVRNIFVPRGYREKNTINDIAVLELNGYLKEDGKTVQRIDLISSNLRAGEHCIIYGWGVVDCYEKYAGMILANIIQSTKMTTIGNNRCVESSTSVIRPGSFCAVNLRNHSQTCRGDSGGPLVCRGQVAGVDSHGNGVTANAEIFTSVWAYNKWIKHYNNKKDSVSFRGGAGRQLFCSVVFIIINISSLIV